MRHASLCCSHDHVLKSPLLSVALPSGPQQLSCAPTAPCLMPCACRAAKVTNGLITQAVPPNTEFNMIVTNAVYFKGLWEYGFDKSLTRRRDFTALTSDGSSKVRSQSDKHGACAGARRCWSWS